MNKAKKKFILYAVLAVFVLLTLLLGVINASVFTMAAHDADEITEIIASGKGKFRPEEGMVPGALEDDGREPIGPMGPDSPELFSTVRYFTVSFNTADESKEPKLVAYNISAVSEEEAVEWAKELKNEETGWTRGTYRYRVYERGKKVYVTVIDQGREMLTAYRILMFSVIGIALAVLLSWLFLRFAAKKVFAPVEEADRKQRSFIANAEKDFKLPLTVISANAELIDRANGPTDETRAINRQVRNMDSIVRRLGSLTAFEQEDLAKTEFSLSELVQLALDENEERFVAADIKLERQIESGIMLCGEQEAFMQLMRELIENALKYARQNACFRLFKEGDRVKLVASNGTELPNGSVDQVFDRFTVLANAEKGSVGLGLAYVKAITVRHNGRVSAAVEDGSFVLKLDL